MDVQRAGDYARFVQDGILRTQTSQRYDTAQQQASTGLQAINFSDGADTLPQVFNITENQSSIGQYQENITQAQGRLKIVENSLVSIMGITQEFRARLGGVLNAGNPDTSFAQFCNDALESVAQSLNAQDIKRNNVFGGTSWEGAVVDLSALPAPGLGAPVSTNYYLGDSGRLSVHVNDNKNLDYTYRADDAAIAQVLHCLKVGATAASGSDRATTDMQRLTQAFDMISQATTDLSNMYASVGNTQKALDVENTSLSNLSQILEEMEVDYKEVNVVEAWMACSMIRGQMEMQIANAAQNLQLTKTMINAFK